MGKVAKFDSGGAAAYAAINLGSDQSEVWVEFRMWSNAEAVDAQAQRILFWADGLYPDPDDAILWAGVGPDPGPGASGPILVEAHFKDDGDYELFHDGVSIQTVSFGPNAGIRTIAMPLLFADGGIVYLDDVKIGTTRHGTDLFADDFEDGTFDAWTDVVGDASIVDDTDIDVTTSTLHDIVVWIANLDTSETVDISSICLVKKASVRHNHVRSMTVQVPSAHPLISGTMGDGYRIIRRGLRKLLMFRDGECIHHGRLFLAERDGDGTENLTNLTSFDWLIEAGYDSEDRAGRPVRALKDNGGFIDPQFAPTPGGSIGDPISGGDLIYQALVNSEATGTESDPDPGEGPLPIHIDVANFDLDVPPAVDLSTIDAMNWPILIGDFIQQLIDTNVIDVYLRPIHPDEGLDGDEMVEIFVRNEFGTDRSETVHFDYWTGSKNAQKCRHVEDFATINNKLYDYLGPRVSKTAWKGNITPGSPGTTVDPSDSRALYGTFMQIRVFDSTEAESSVRALFTALWNAEQGLRVEPRDMLFITPNPDSAALFQPYTDYNVGDLVTINTGPQFGVEITGAVERVYGWDVEWDRQGIERVTQLLTSADAVS